MKTTNISFDNLHVLLTSLCKDNSFKFTKSQLNNAAACIHKMAKYFFDDHKLDSPSLTLEVSGYKGDLYFVRFVTELNKDNELLKYMFNKNYMITVGKRGKINFVLYPDCMKQFKNKTYLGYHVGD